MKKTILGLGSAAAIIAPIAGVVACDDSETKAKEKTLKEILASKVLVLKTEDAALSDAALLTAIKAQLEMDYGLELKKAHMLTVNSDKADGTTHSAITATTDADAKKVYVTVKVNDEEAKDDAKNIEIKVRKETAKEQNARIVSTLKKHIEMEYDTVAKALDLTKTVTAGISNDSQYTSAQFVTSLKNKLTADNSWATNTIDGWIASAEWTLKKIDTTAAVATGNNTVNISTGKKVEVEISSGASDDKAGPTMVSFYVKVT